MIRLRWLSVIILAGVVASCDPEMVYERFMTTEGGEWRWEDRGRFEVEVTDTVSLHNLYIQVRHTTDYPMSNLYMFVTLKGPSGQFTRDTVNMILAAPDGVWLGKGPGKLRQLRLLYRKNIRFGEPGLYSISLEQAMRRSPLPVTDVGLRIERVNP